MKKIIIRGRKVFGGFAKAEALVSNGYISGWGGTDPGKGMIIDRMSDICGSSFADKILVFQGAKGSSGWSINFHWAKEAEKAPAAMLFNEMTTKAALGVICMGIPALTDFEQNPIEIIETGDFVKVFADEGYIEIVKNGKGD